MDMINEPGRLCTLFWKSNISDDMLLSFQFLRVLNFSGSGIEELSAKISKLIYLRYLDLSDTKIRALPNSICKLYNLQTLRVSNCFPSFKFPEEMANMISLRHIYRNCHHYLVPIHMPLNMGQLTSLQTLPFFNVGLKKGRRIEELGRLKNLRGELTIYSLQLVRNKEEARTAYLLEKPNIYRLAYIWSHNESEGCEINHEHVLDGLQPHPNIKTLEVVNYFGTIFPSWFSERLLPNLVKLKLSGCKRCKEIPSLGQLKFLRHLQLIGFLELECIGPTFYGVEINDNGSSSNNGNIHVFPSLKELVLENMRSLIEWKGDEVGVRMFPRLEKLRITHCPLLKSTPTQFEILRELKIERVDSELPLLNLCSNLTSLVDLFVDHVKELTCLPSEMLHNNVSLQLLSVSKCEEFRELPQSLYNLKILKILSCPNLTSVPVPSGENYFSSLEDLCVLGCKNLVSLPLHVGEMPSLSHLDISQCPKLINLPSGGLLHLTGLTNLRIGPFSEMMDFEAFQLIFNGIQQLLSLRRLHLWGHLHWDSLPYQLMQHSSLTDIHIYDFGIEALPHRFGNLTSLESLGLTRCKRLRHLDFSDAMPKLWYLSMYDCPLLEALSDGLGNLASLEYKKVAPIGVAQTPSGSTFPIFHKFDYAVG
ncbi:putative disease resistance protein RGA3 [Solanum stenotomum]|uniref:putative disease resistance protein RGA3 n=1 Tax=Solanum stenotomum TaxID=172797 RepID=UPI0020D0EDCC|nr:putative disease resistance protein RGA3 [Solanum stenotomum]